jgi:hypothetical protein
MRMRRGDAHLFQRADRQLQRAAAREALVQLQHFGHLPLHRQVGIERRHRVLEDHRDAVAADAIELVRGQ